MWVKTIELEKNPFIRTNLKKYKKKPDYQGASYDGRTNGRTNERTDERKSPCVLQDFVPFGAAAQKALNGLGFAIGAVM